MEDNEPKILKDMRKLRRLVGGVKAEKKAGGPAFAVKSAKDLMIRFRSAIDRLRMQVGVVNSNTYVAYAGYDNEGKNFKWLVVANVTVRFESEDGSYRDYVGVGNGGDSQDKAAGKAFTYAWKSAIIYALSAPDAEMVDCDDEDPFEIDGDIVETEKKKPGRPRKIVPIVEETIVPKSELVSSTSELSGYLESIKNAEDKDKLEELGKRLAKLEWSDADTSKLGTAYTARMKELRSTQTKESK